MHSKKIISCFCLTVVLTMSGCSRQQSDWQKTRETNTTDSYEQFLKKYPSGEFTAQAQARVKELYEERDWQRARDADTPEAYQAFLKQYPDGKWTEEARIRVENFTLAQAPSGVGGTTGGSADAGSGAGVPPETPVAGSAAPSSADGGAATTTVPAAAPAKEPAKAQPKPAAGTYAVQLGAFKSGAAAAHERWAVLQKEFPSVLGGLSPKIAAKKSDSGSLYRLQAIGLSEKHARSICDSLTAKSQACIVVPPA